VRNKLGEATFENLPDGPTKRAPIQEFIQDEEDYMQAVEQSMDAEYERFARVRFVFLYHSWFRNLQFSRRVWANIVTPSPTCQNRELKEPMSVVERRREQTANKTAKKKKSTLEQMTNADFQRAIDDAQRDAYAKGVYHKMLQSNPDGDSDSESNDEPGWLRIYFCVFQTFYDVKVKSNKHPIKKLAPPKVRPRLLLRQRGSPKTYFKMCQMTSLLQIWACLMTPPTRFEAVSSYFMSAPANKTANACVQP